MNLTEMFSRKLGSGTGSGDDTVCVELLEQCPLVCCMDTICLKNSSRYECFA